MTIALAVIFFALLLIYCGVKGRSLSSAIQGKAESGGAGGFAGAS